MSDDDAHPGMSPGADLAAKLREKGYRTIEDVQFALEVAPRSDIWIYVAHEEDGAIINATGFFEDEASAFLAGEQHRADWRGGQDDPPPLCTPIPLFIDRRQIDDG